MATSIDCGIDCSYLVALTMTVMVNAKCMPVKTGEKTGDYTQEETPSWKVPHRAA
jgi:hypothetical protein